MCRRRKELQFDCKILGRGSLAGELLLLIATAMLRDGYGRVECLRASASMVAMVCPLVEAGVELLGWPTGVACFRASLKERPLRIEVRAAW